jgi:hypothetical protein
MVPRRGYHCDICGVCIQQYDHHCTWINNCVGKRNIARFIFFLTFLILTLLFVGVFSVLGLIALILDDPGEYSFLFKIAYTYEDLFQRVLIIVLLSINFMSSLFVVPIIALFVVQIKNLLKNQTTYEMMRAPSKSPSVIKSKMKGYTSKMRLRNCKVMCSDDPQYMTASLTTNDLMDDQESMEYSGNK